MKRTKAFIYSGILVLVVIGALFSIQSGDKNKETNATNTASRQQKPLRELGYYST